MLKNLLNQSIKLQSFLARAGVSSRRKAEEIIIDGRVRINGIVVEKLGTRVFEKDKVYLDGKEIFKNKSEVYLVLNKPKGFICSNEDEKGRNKAIDLVQGHFSQRLFSLGRLDIQSAGLIFFTSDGYFANSVMHPSRGIEKEYIVTVQKGIEEAFLKTYKNGIKIDGIKYNLKKYTILNKNVVSLVLEEGKNREIRNVFKYGKITIRNLVRIRIGCVYLDSLKEGYYRHLTDKELEYFRNFKNDNIHRRTCREW